MTNSCVEIIDGMEICPMTDEYVSRETCSKCFKGTENQLGTILEDTKFIKKTLIGENGLVIRVSVLEEHKKEGNRRMTVNLMVITIVFTIVSVVVANFGKIIGIFNNVPK